MALPKKKPVKKSSTAMVKKKPAKATKAAAPKALVKKKSIPKKTSAPKLARKVERKSPAMVPEKKKVMVVRRSWFSFFRTSAMILVLAAGAAAVSLSPSTVDQFKASILAQVDRTDLASEPVEESKGILISYEMNGVNEQKLMDIFRTVFPETTVKEIHYQSDEGKQLISELGVMEVPNIYFKQDAFESERLSEVVKDLFHLQGDYYGLNVSLVNPSHQVKIQGALSTEGGVWLGQAEAPITVYVYSDLKCQHCRVSERNNTVEWKKLMEEGLVKLVYLDLPQDAESTFHSTALSCYYDQKKDTEGYLELRERLFTRPNLTKAYMIRELKKMGLEYDQECDEPAYRTLFRNRMKAADAEGVTGVPALYISESEGNKYVRFTGAKDFSEYQQTLDKLLGENNPEETVSAQ
jgi:protein-disulfide isomerase